MADKSRPNTAAGITTSSRIWNCVDEQLGVVTMQQDAIETLFGGLNMKQIHDKEFTALIGMPAPERYAIFVRRVADWQVVWGLRSEHGWRLMANEDGIEVVPVWPHQRFAEAIADVQKQEQPATISLDDWLNKWLPGMMRDGRQVAVFPIPGQKGIVVSPERLKADLLAECEQYE